MSNSEGEKTEIDNTAQEERAEKIKLFSFRKKGFLLGIAMAALAWYLCVKKAALFDWQAALISLGFVLSGAVSLNGEHKAAKAFTWLLFLLSTLFSFYIVETLNKNNLYDDLTVTQGILNMVWYAMVLLIFYFVVRRKTPAALLCILLFLFIGTANHYILVFRGTVIFPCDLLSLKTAANVADNFNFTPDRTMVYCFLLCALYAAFLLGNSYGWKKDRAGKKIIIPVVGLYVLYGYVFFNTDMLRRLDIYAQQWKTQANGYILNFTAALRYSFVDEPEDYSAQEVQNFADTVKAPKAKGKHPTNIICIMNESFADFSIFEGFESTEDPMPFYHSLTENTIKGTTCVSVTGGGTANSEFEFLTGNTLAFLPQSTVAYQLYFKEDTPSSVDEFSSLGYECVSFHPYLASGWNRPLVYEYMGFGRQLYKEDVTEIDIVRKYIGDSSDYKTLYSLTDERKGDDMFIFNVTMQNHSGYKYNWTDIENPVSVTGRFDGEEYTAEVNQFLSLMKESDNALKELIEHYQSVDEDTLIVLFGDHQPPLPNEFYEDLYGKKLDRRTAEETMQQYKTPFFIWANYDIEEEEGIEISLNFLMNKVFETAGMPLTKYQSFLADVKKELPVVNRTGFKTKDGEYFEAKDRNKLSEKQRQLLEMYEYMQYNNIFDNENMPECFFSY